MGSVMTGGSLFDPAAESRRCASCHALLFGDPDEELTGDAGRPLCGECVRARNFDEELFELDAADGDLDGDID